MEGDTEDVPAIDRDGLTEALSDAVADGLEVATGDNDIVPRLEGVWVRLTVGDQLTEGDGETEAALETVVEGEDDAVGVTVTDSVGPIKSVSVATFNDWMTGLAAVVLDMPTMTTNSDPDGTTRATLMLLHTRGVVAPGVRPTVVLVPMVVPPVTMAL